MKDSRAPLDRLGSPMAGGNRIRRLFAFVSISVACLLSCSLQASAVAPQTKPKNVLVLFSLFGGQDFLDTIEPAIRSRIPGPVNFFVAYLDYPQMEEKSYRDSAAETFRRRYADVNLDLVITHGPMALPFALQYRDTMFRGVPIVFTQIAASELEGRELGSGVTGVTAPVGIRETIDLALHLHPDTNAIAVITGVSTPETYWLRVAHSELLRHQDKVKEFDIVGPASGQLLEQVAALPPHTVVLFQLVPDVRNQSAVGVWDILSAATQRVPTYSAWPTLCLDHGCIGGDYLDSTRIALSTADVAARVLAGQRPGDIPIVHSTDLQVRVDWRPLRRWNISEAALPAGSTIINREYSIWELYKWRLIGLLILLVIETALIAALIRLAIAQKRTVRQLEQRRKQEALIAGCAGDFINLPPEMVNVEIERSFHRLLEFFDLDRISLFEYSAETAQLHLLCSRTSDSAGKPPAILDMRRLPWTTSQIMQNRPIVVSRLEDLPEEASSLGKLLSDDGVRSMIAFPLQQHGKTFAALAFSTELTERRWEPDDVTALRTITNIFSSALQRKQSEETAKLAEQERETLAGRLLEAQEQERSRLARELHDDFNQRLAVLAIDLEKCAEMINDSPAQAKEFTLELWNRAGEIGADLHTLSHQLHSSTLQSLGLVVGVGAFCDEFSQQQDIQVDFAHESIPRSVPPEIALCLFRIVQEGLRNVKKHSGASRAEVRLEGSADGIHLSICDRGAGFDRGDHSAHVGLGIQSMEERLRFIGGRFTIQSAPMQGTLIDVWTPLTPAVRIPMTPGIGVAKCRCWGCALRDECHVRLTSAAAIN